MPKEPRFYGETTEKSSKTMSRIKGKDTKIEIVLRKALWARGYHYRKNFKDLPGRPDIALTKYKIAIFCDGEFFHGKDWEEIKPRLQEGANPEYWVNKIQRNIDRDNEKDKELHILGWKVLHFWGKDILERTDECVDIIEEVIFEIKKSWSEDGLYY